jgi:cation:H+ antiporter
MIDWIIFAGLAAVIIFAGMRLSYYADVLALKFRISSSVIGALLVSAITSLPELTASLGSVITVGAPDMAVGNVFGSNLFNISIIALCEIVFLKSGVFRNIHQREIRPVGISLAIIAIAVAGLLLPFGFELFGLRFGLGSVLVVAAYLLFFRWMHKSGQLEEIIAVEGAGQADQVSTVKALTVFTLCAVLIVASGISLAVVGDRLVASTGMTHSFMGLLFLATATSLPELSVSVSAARRGSYDLLVGTVIGSNIFNVLIVALSDFFYTAAPLNIPANLGWSHLLSAAGVAVSSLVLIAAIRLKPRRAGLSLLLAALIIGAYILCLLAIYKGWV